MNITVEEKQFKEVTRGTFELESDAAIESKFVANGLQALSFLEETGALTDKSTQADVAAHIESVCLQKLKEEIDNDPAGRGYTGKTGAEIAELVNAPYIRQITATKMLPSRRLAAFYPQDVTAIDVKFAVALSNTTVGDPAALLLARLQDEIAKDPAGRGYAGKTDQAVADLLNAPYSGSVTFEQNGFPRVAVIWVGIPYAPNVVTEDDVKAANGI